MMRANKAGISAAVLLLGAGLSLLSCGNRERLCGEKVKHEVGAPDGMYVATLFERNCGATTNFVAHINLRPAETKYLTESSGTVIQGEILVVEGRPEISISWKSTKELDIQIDPKTNEGDIFKQESSWQDIVIRYRRGE